MQDSKNEQKVTNYILYNDFSFIRYRINDMMEIN